jgi:hypothetical protein
MSSNHLNQLLGIQDCFIVPTRNGEIAHTWVNLNVANWDVEEVLQYPIQNDGCVDLYSLYSFLIIYWILTYVMSTKTISFYRLLMWVFYH